LRAALQHQDKVRKLVLISTPFKRAGWYPEIQYAMAHGSENVEMMKQTPLYEMYVRLAPRPQDFGVLFSKLGEMLGRDYDWSKEVAELKIPVMIVVGDSDSVVTSHAVEFFQLLGGGARDGGWDGSGIPKSKLAILPGTTHYDIFKSQLLVPMVQNFFESP
jgi:pimeloyl-ACP methyl ester carboxylesterase